MVRRCAVLDCTSTDLTTLSHRFPRKGRMAEIWQQSLDLAHIPLSELYQKNVVCTLHFTATDYRNEMSKNLNATAIPVVGSRQADSITTINANQSPKLHPHELNFTEVEEEERFRDDEFEEPTTTTTTTSNKDDDAISSDDKPTEERDDGVDQIIAKETELFYQDDSNMNYDTGDLSFPDPCKDLPDFSTSDFMLEPPDLLDNLPSEEPINNHQEINDAADDQFVYIMEVPTPATPEDHHHQQPSGDLASKEDDTSSTIADGGHQVRVSIEDGQLVVFQTTTSSEESFGNYRLVSTSPSFNFEIDQRRFHSGEIQQMASSSQEEDYLPAGRASSVVYHQEEEDEDDVFTDEMRLYNEMSKKSLVQLMVKANGKIRELEERLETIESAHSKVLGSLELFRNVLRP